MAYLSCSAKPLVARNTLGPILVSLSCSAKPLVARNTLGPIVVSLSCSAKPLVARNTLRPKTSVGDSVFSGLATLALPM